MPARHMEQEVEWAARHMALDVEWPERHMESDVESGDSTVVGRVTGEQPTAWMRRCRKRRAPGRVPDTMVGGRYSSSLLTVIHVLR